MGNYKRCTVVFNLDNPLHKELFDWCNDVSFNFSDLARTVLFNYKQSRENKSVQPHVKTFNPVHQQEKEIEIDGITIKSPSLSLSKVTDKEAMTGLL